MNFSRKARLERRIDKHGKRLLSGLQLLAASAGKDVHDVAPTVRRVIVEASAVRRELPTRLPQWRALGDIIAGATSILDGDVAGGCARVDAGYVAFCAAAGGKR